ncbi:MAG TPA: acyl-CoA dehydrogenase family protein [Acidimicrobiales bacterium]|jgi:alkylation response protein AidB-like acyl-CoA dehydrogenase|nr:acyl-CoA dehydrogenase family protein [Acidimicrobiales bacterium]
MLIDPVAPADELVRSHLRALLADHDPLVSPASAFLGAQFDRGLAWVWFPAGCGGMGLEPHWQEVVDRELASAGAPAPDIDRNVIGYGMAAPTIATHGDDAQRARWLRPLFAGEEVWCQLFSEPGAGSDLASLATRAVRAGDEWIVDGQKVWTTLGHTARWGLLLARTDPTVPKHRGLTAFVLDMIGPGVDVRPLRQITGDAEFNEVFMTGARIPDAHRLGSVGQGWSVALTTLMNERVSLGGSVPEQGSGAIAHVLALWRASPRRNPVLRDRVVQLWIRAEVLRLTNERARSARLAGTPGPEGSAGKLLSAELNQAVFDLCVDLFGAEGLVYPDGYELRRPERATLIEGDPRFLFLRSRANTIEGGSVEVLRNVIGERVLGLPPEPRVDREVSWSAARR